MKLELKTLEKFNPWKVKTFTSFSDLNFSNHHPLLWIAQQTQFNIQDITIYIKVIVVCTYVPFSRPNRRTNLHQILHRPPHQLREGS